MIIPKKIKIVSDGNIISYLNNRKVDKNTYHIYRYDVSETKKDLLIGFPDHLLEKNLRDGLFIEIK